MKQETEPCTNAYESLTYHPGQVSRKDSEPSLHVFLKARHRDISDLSPNCFANDKCGAGKELAPNDPQYNGRTMSLLTRIYIHAKESSIYIFLCFLLVLVNPVQKR